MHPLGLKTAGLAQGIRVAFGIWNCIRFENDRPLFCPFFLVSDGPTPLKTPPARPPPVQTASEMKQTRPVREL